MDDLLKGVNLYLVGMMGSGKTTVGQLLADRLGYQFVDTDVLIERVAGQSVSQIFAEVGEAAFRKLESQVLAQLSAYTRRAIATGGGIVLNRENWGYLRHGIVVWLDVPLEQLQTRLQADTTRPLLQDTDLATKLRTLMEQRQSLYAQADVRVTCDPGETPTQVATRTIDQIRQTIKPTGGVGGRGNWESEIGNGK
ncbi:shikimate kinase [Kovacikia minuta]|uniref:shikimate kinase n=1 Tax=Kovacikia minuta TaxID=2931930 RepID=UPI001CECEF19|nr:shikimate kinase [Kovacikia minuta]